MSQTESKEIKRVAVMLDRVVSVPVTGSLNRSLLYNYSDPALIVETAK